MSKILLVDTNFSSTPIYQFLLETGHDIIVVGRNPKDALAKSAKHYINLDYSDFKKIKKLVADLDIEYLVPGCNDQSYLVCAYLNSNGQFLGIDSIENTEIINNKGKFRIFAAKYGLPTPRVLTEEELGTRWPVIVKPVDTFSGHGVSIIRENNKEELMAALVYARKASKAGVCIVEDYIEGQLYSHSAFIKNGKIVSDYIVEEHSTANPFVVDTSRVLYDFSESMLEHIRTNIHFIANQLNLQDGLIHTQFISNGCDYWLIEMTRRCPGDLYSQLIELSTGFPYAENYARSFIGMPLKSQQSKIKHWVMRHTLTQPIEYTLGSIAFNVPLKIMKWIPISLAGDRLLPSPYGRIGVLFCTEPNEQSLIEIFTKTLKRQLYNVSE